MTMPDLWLNDLPLQTMLAISVGLIAMGALMLAFYPFANKKMEILHDRALRLKTYRENLERGIAFADDDEVDEGLGRKHNQIIENLIWVLRKISRATGYIMLFDSKEQLKLKRLLLLAGIQNQDALVLLFTGKMLGMVLTGLLVAVIWMFGLIKVQPILFWLGALIAVILGGTIPEKIVSMIAKRRQAEIQLTLPDALDLMIVCTNAGFSLDVTVARVSHDIRSFASAMADELRLLADELKILQDRREALENLANRTDVAGIKSMVTTLIQASKLGTPINQALKTVAEEIRREHILSLEEWAAKVPTKMTFPIVLLILPAIFLIVGGPAFISVMRML